MFASRTMIDADELATLALSAATQIELFQQRQAADLQSIGLFAEALARFSGLSDQPESAFIDSDPVVTDMLGMTVSRIIAPTDNPTQLRDQIKTLIEGFQDLNLKEHKEVLEQAKRFCLEIYSSISQKCPNSSYNETGVFDYDYSYSGQGISASATGFCT